MRIGVAVLFLVACGGDPIHHLPDGGTTALVITPADLTVTIIDGQVVTQPYTAAVPDGSGNLVDVTASTTFSLASDQWGTFAGPTLAISGQGAGPTRVRGVANGVSGDTGLTVMLKTTILDPMAPPGAPGLFGGATENPALAPAIAYPLDHILVPPNLGQFDVHWANDTANVDNLYEIAMSNQYVDIKLYTTGLDPANPQPYWTLFQPTAWYPIASSRQQLTLTVAGMDAANPAQKGTAAAQHVDVTNEDAKGGIYYWSTSQPEGIYRYDVATPAVPPAPYFPAGQEPGGAGTCMGCHALSRDGTKLALTLDGGGGRGTIVNVADRSLLVPIDGSVPPVYWNFATFTAKADKLVTLSNGVMTLRALDGSVLVDAIPNTAATSATHPEISPDGKQLVNVEGCGGDFSVGCGGIVTRSFDDATNTFGSIQQVLPQDTTDGTSSYYPSYSPDGQWLVVTRVAGDSYNDSLAETWVVKADGSMPPVKLATADLATGNLTNSWARWVPFAQTFGPTNEPLFYLTFSSVRPFGVRIPTGGRPQIWMTPFFPARAAAGQDPSGAAFRVPFQGVDTANHIAQWTQAVVVIQ